MFGLLLLVDRARSDRVCGGTPEVDAAPPARHRQCISQTDAPEGLHLPTSQKGEILLPQRVLALLDTDTHYCVFIDLHKQNFSDLLKCTNIGHETVFLQHLHIKV